MSLQNLQAEFAEYLLADDSFTDFAQPAANTKIYRNNVNTHLVHALQETYPLITQLLGVEYFSLVANEYIKQYPSRSSNLHDYGEYVGSFLSEYPTLNDFVYLEEVALFEWTCHVLSFAANHAPLDVQTLEAFAPNQYEQLHFTLHPASALIQFHYPILEIIDLCKGHRSNTLHLNDGGVNLLIIRRELDICLVTLAEEEYQFLHALQQGDSLASALQKALQVNIEFRLDEKLPHWVQDKTIVDCYLA